MDKRFWKPKKIGDGQDWRPVRGVTKHFDFDAEFEPLSDGRVLNRCKTKYIKRFSTKDNY